MRRFAFALALVLLAAPAAPAWAQVASSVAVDIETAVLAWDWAKGTGGDVVEFHVTCGPPAQPPSILHVVADPLARSVPLKTVVQATGDYECVVMAVNPFGESAPSNQVVFSAGTLPAPPTNLRIVSPQ